MKKHNLQKLLAWSLLAVMLASCSADPVIGDDSDTAQSDTSVSETTTAAPETEPPDTRIFKTADEATVKKLELDGYEFNVYLRPEGNIWQNKDIYAKETTGDLLNDITYERNKQLEEQFGFTVHARFGAKTQLKELSTLVASGDEWCDAAFPMALQAGTYATEGILSDLLKMPYLDFESDEWNNTFNNSLRYGGKLFYANGAISVNSYTSVHAFYFNKDLHKANNLEDPYQLVRDGKWTIDKLNGMAKAAAADLNGDGKRDNTDRWGIAWQSSVSGLTMFYGAGGVLTEVNPSTGTPEFVLGNENSRKAFDKVSSMISDANTYYLGATDECKQIFEEGRSLFIIEGLYYAEPLRNVDVTFGLLPTPKLDEAQESYIQYTDDWCPSPVVVPITVKDRERIGFILQVMAETNNEMIRPVFYDICLNNRSLRDKESSEMLDIIVKSYKLDNAGIFWKSTIISKFRTLFTSGDTLASFVASLSDTMNAKIKDTTEALAKAAG